jgi:hypothetical protein
LLLTMLGIRTPQLPRPHLLLRRLLRPRPRLLLMLHLLLRLYAVETFVLKLSE